MTLGCGYTAYALAQNICSLGDAMDSLLAMYISSYQSNNTKIFTCQNQTSHIILNTK